MIFSKEVAKQLECLVHPDIERAICLLLDYVIAEKELINDDPTVTDIQLRQLQGQKLLVKDIKQYRIRLKDAVIREQERQLEDK